MSFKCLYISSRREKDATAIDIHNPHGVPSFCARLPQCRVLVDQGALDDECYNTYLDENTCRISPLNPENVGKEL